MPPGGSTRGLAVPDLDLLAGCQLLGMTATNGIRVLTSAMTSPSVVSNSTRSPPIESRIWESDVLRI